MLTELADVSTSFASLDLHEAYIAAPTSQPLGNTAVQAAAVAVDVGASEISAAPVVSKQNFTDKLEANVAPAITSSMTRIASQTAAAPTAMPMTAAAAAAAGLRPGEISAHSQTPIDLTQEVDDDYGENEVQIIEARTNVKASPSAAATAAVVGTPTARSIATAAAHAEISAAPWGGSPRPDARPPPSVAEACTVCVQQLHPKVEETDVRECFATCGAIETVKLPRDRSGRSKGYAV